MVNGGCCDKDEVHSATGACSTATTIITNCDEYADSTNFNCNKCATGNVLIRMPGTVPDQCA